MQFKTFVIAICSLAATLPLAPSAQSQPLDKADKSVKKQVLPPSRRPIVPDIPGAKGSLKKSEKNRKKSRLPRVLAPLKRKRWRPFERYRVFLLTVGPGDWIYSYFGHNAIRVVDRVKRSSYNYNFGTFGFPSDFSGVLKFVWDYLQLDLKYSLSRQTMREMINRYRWQDRDFNMRELLLSPEEKKKLVEYLRWHYREENRDYTYHHYRANCSTKVRDALRVAVGDVFWERAQVKRGATYRKLVLEKVRKNPLLMVGMDFGMGPPADRELTWWEEMFLPEKLEEYAAAGFWRELRGRPLASSPPRILNRRRKAPHKLPFSPPLFIYLLAVSIGLIGLGLVGRPRFSLWSTSTLTLFALSGSGLLFLIFLSEFPTPKGNANAFFFHPLHLLPLFLMRKRPLSPGKKRFLTLYFVLHSVGIALYLLLRFLRLVPPQENFHYLFLAAVVFIIFLIEIRRGEIR